MIGMDASGNKLIQDENHYIYDMAIIFRSNVARLYILRRLAARAARWLGRKLYVQRAGLKTSDKFKQ